jgi:hypothetical protein
MAQYLDHQGIIEEPPMPTWYMFVTATEPHTYGAALRRASML